MRHQIQDASDSEYCDSSDGDRVSEYCGEEGPLSPHTSDTELSARSHQDVNDDYDDDNDAEVQLFGGNAHPPEYYQQGCQDFNMDELNVGDYAPGVERTLATITNHWNDFCKSVLKEDANKSFANVSTATLYNFLNWRLNQKEGKNGRRLKGIKTKASLVTYWDSFRLVFERAQGTKLDAKLNRGMRKGLRNLARLHNLSSEKRPNRCMTIDELREHNETTLGTTEKSFDLGELRILAVLFNLLIATPGARPQAILSLRFGDILIVLCRDPKGGPHKLLLKFTPEFTKTYLGAKDAKTFTVPEVIGDPSLLLSPHVFLLGILFRHRAFRADSLVSVQQVEQLDIHPDEQELVLPLRQELKDTWLFRKAIKTSTGHEISATQPITYPMMAGTMKTIGRILGNAYDTIPYNLRYNAANEFDQNPHVTSATRNLILDHSSSDPFQHNYLGRLVPLDIWGILRGQEPQHALVKQSCTLGHSKSKRRPIRLTSEQSASIATHPSIRRLEKQLRHLPARSGERRAIRKKIRSEKERLRRTCLQITRDKWTDEQAVSDIERQINGHKFSDSKGKITAVTQPPAQAKLLAALTAPDDGTLDGYYRRRKAAVEAIIAYCSVEEGRHARQQVIHASLVAHKSPEPIDDPIQGDLLRQAVLSVFIENEKDRPRRCFVCVGAAQSMQQDDPRFTQLLREFYSASDLTKHLRSRHLRYLKEDATTECQVCNLPLKHKMHFQNHAKRVHGTVS